MASFAHLSASYSAEVSDDGGISGRRGRSSGPASDTPESTATYSGNKCAI